MDHVVAPKGAGRVRIGVPREVLKGECRVALTPEVVERLRRRGLEILVGTFAGERSGYTDEAFEDAGAEIVWGEEIWRADLLLCVNAPPPELIARHLPTAHGKVLVAHLDPWVAADSNKALASSGITAIAVEAIPRIPRARTMDARSSQAAAAGCAAMWIAARESRRFFAMLSAAAGPEPPAKVLVLGAGAAGVQAATTARRLGAMVTDLDFRDGADGEIAKVCEAITESVVGQDVIVAAATTTGRKAPVLVTADAVRGMRPGSVIVDVAAETGGNCELTVPGDTVVTNGVKVIGARNLPSQMPGPASQLYAENLENLVDLLVDQEGRMHVDLEDEIVAAATITHGGEIANDRAAGGTGAQNGAR